MCRAINWTREGITRYCETICETVVDEKEHDTYPLQKKIYIWPVLTELKEQFHGVTTRRKYY